MNAFIARTITRIGILGICATALFPVQVAAETSAQPLVLFDQYGRPYYPTTTQTYGGAHFDSRTFAVSTVRPQTTRNISPVTRSTRITPAPVTQFQRFTPPNRPTPRSTSPIMDTWSVGVFR